MKLNKKGFTLVELLITIVIVGLVVGFLLSILVNYIRKNLTSKVVKDMIEKAYLEYKKN